MRFAAERCEDVALLTLESGEHGEYFPTPRELKEIARNHRRRRRQSARAPAHRRRFRHAAKHAVFGRQSAGGRGTHRTAAAARLRPARRLSLAARARSRPHRRTAPMDGRGSGRNRRLSARARSAFCRGKSGGLSPKFLGTAWIDGTPYSRCLDVGHIWKAGGDPAPVLAAWLPRVRVIHLHGLEPRAVAAPFPIRRRAGPPAPVITSRSDLRPRTASTPLCTRFGDRASAGFSTSKFSAWKISSSPMPRSCNRGNDTRETDRRRRVWRASPAAKEKI